MNVLVLGSGGREHTIAWKLSKSPKVENVFCCPGNPGTAGIGKNINISLDDFAALSNFVVENKISLTIVGPEGPLANGIVDYFREKNFLIFGPTKKAAEIESSKAFAKWLMEKYDIPTAAYRTFNKNEYDEIIKYIKGQSYPIVIKADGLAAGKGVIIAETLSEAKRAVDDIVKNQMFGHAGDKVVIEEFLSGEEASIFAVTDGKDFITLPAAQDHKRIFDNDQGKNTGGMGAYAPTKLITQNIYKKTSETIIKPVLKGMALEGRTFTGCLYCGLIITKDGPKVIEFNCRFGDPETQAVLPLIESDFAELVYSSVTGGIKNYKVSFFNGTAVCVVLASKGYPDMYESLKPISGLEKINDDEDNVFAFHAGTKSSEGSVLTSGGRVLGITALCKDKDLAFTINKCYESVKKVNFEGMHYRMDIGKKGLKYY